MDYSLFAQNVPSSYYIPTQREPQPPIDPALVDPNFEISDLPVKLELRYVIEARRAAQGLEYPNVDHQEAKKENQLSIEEEEKRRLRRERNKVAASKCRSKRKSHVKTLQEILDDLESSNNSLEAEIAYLNAEKEQLEKMLDTHQCMCKTNPQDPAAGRQAA